MMKTPIQLAKEKETIATLVPYVIARIKEGQPWQQAIRLAFGDVTEFSAEMAQGTTSRARRARQILSAIVWHDIRQAADALVVDRRLAAIIEELGV